MWNFLEKHFEEVLAGTLVMFMASMVFFQVVMRYVFSMPTSWSDELAIYAMLWSVYISVAWAVRERAHIRVMNFVQLFPAKIALGLTVVPVKQHLPHRKLLRLLSSNHSFSPFPQRDRPEAPRA